MRIKQSLHTYISCAKRVSSLEVFFLKTFG
jgi:hypothetical protein